MAGEERECVRFRRPGKSIARTAPHRTNARRRSARCFDFTGSNTDKTLTKGLPACRTPPPLSKKASSPCHLPQRTTAPASSRQRQRAQACVLLPKQAPGSRTSQPQSHKQQQQHKNKNKNKQEKNTKAQPAVAAAAKPERDCVSQVLSARCGTKKYADVWPKTKHCIIYTYRFHAPLPKTKGTQALI